MPNQRFQEPISSPVRFAHSLGKGTSDRSYSEDYDYSDNGTGRTNRGTFDEDVRTTSESSLGGSNIPLEAESGKGDILNYRYEFGRVCLWPSKDSPGAMLSRSSG